MSSIITDCSASKTAMHCLSQTPPQGGDLRGTIRRGATIRGRYADLLHGMYVYIAVGRFWQAVYEAADRPADRPYVVEQLLRIGKQLTLAHDVLASNARFTPIGEGAFGQMTADIAALHERMRLAALAGRCSRASDDGRRPCQAATEFGERPPVDRC